MDFLYLGNMSDFVLSWMTQDNSMSYNVTNLSRVMAIVNRVCGWGYEFWNIGFKSRKALRSYYTRFWAVPLNHGKSKKRFWKKSGILCLIRKRYVYFESNITSVWQGSSWKEIMKRKDVHFPITYTKMQSFLHQR